MRYIYFVCDWTGYASDPPTSTVKLRNFGPFEIYLFILVTISPRIWENMG